VKYAFVKTQLQDYPLSMSCAALGVAVSGYHAWQGRPPAPRTLEAQRLLFLIKTIHHQSGETYGAPRIYAELKDKHAYTGSLNRVKRLLREHGIRAKGKRKFKATTDSQHKLPVAPNRLAQDFSVAAPNRVWLADITYCRTREGWLYLACVLDLFNREIVGWAMKERMTRDLVMDALTMAWFRKRPAPGLIHHSDRGSQYCSGDFQTLLTQYGMLASMSGTGNCFDNAPMESFWHSLKVERVHGAGYETRAQAKQDVFSYIEMFYNVERRHSSLGYLSPRAFEKRYWSEQKESVRSGTD
jgi:transposase InsO family protein